MGAYDDAINTVHSKFNRAYSQPSMGGLQDRYNIQQQTKTAQDQLALQKAQADLTKPDPAIAQAEENRLYTQGTGVGTAKSIWDGQIWVTPEQAAYDRQTRPSMSAFTSTGGGGTGGGTGASGAANYAREDQLRTEDNTRKDTIFNKISSLLSSGGSPRVERGTGASAVQEAASRDAAFARAKEKAGQTARASIQTLQGVMDERGMMGSSVEGAQTGNIIGSAAGGIGEFLRDQAMSEADRATGIADTEYAGQIQQRGQEQSRQQALLGLLAGGGLY